MANPFSIFRKRQKLFLAIAGVGAMVSFILLPPVMRMMEGDSGGAAGTVVSTKYGDIGERQMSTLIQQRQISNTFFQQLLQLTLEAMARSGQIDAQNFNRLAQFKQNELLREGLLLPPNETSVVRSMVAARRAEELGLRVSDERINQLIARVTQDMVPAAEIAGILKNMTVRISQNQLFDIIRPELLANDLLYLVNSGTQTSSTPAERWNYFLRSRQQTTAEVVQVEVDDFIDKVADPNDKELLAYFNKYKDEYPQPDSPEPGFRLPERRDFQYFEADFEHFYNEEAVTDDDVAKYYEENKANYPYQGLAPDTTDSAADEATEGETPAEEPAAETPSEEETPQENAPAEDEMPEGESAPPETEPAPSSEEPAEPPSSETEPASSEEPSSEGSDPPAESEPETSATPEDQASNLVPATGLKQLVSTAVAGALFYQDAGEADAEATDTDSSSDSTATDETASDSTTSSEATEGGAATGETPTDETETTDSQADKPFVPSLSLRDLSVEYLLPRVISQGPDPQYDPLWRVEDSIRTTIAREQAAEKMEAVLAPLRQQMQAYSTNRLDWEIAIEEEKKVPEPPRLDFESMAAGIEGVTAKSTGIVSAQQLVDNWSLGTATVVNSTGQAIGSVIEQAYGSSPDFSPTMAQDSDGNQYLYWFVEKLEARIPTLDDVRDEVVLSWKRQQARGLAEKHAEELATIARDPKYMSLAQAFANKPEIKVVDTGSFSWLTAGDVPMNFGGNQLRLSEIPGVSGMGNSFMRGVFSLDPQSVGVIMNEPKTAVYVVRVGDFTPDEFVLRQQFLAAPYSLYQNAGQIDRRETQLRWFDELLASADIKWVREPRDGQ